MVYNSLRIASLCVFFYMSIAILWNLNTRESDVAFVTNNLTSFPLILVLNSANVVFGSLPDFTVPYDDTYDVVPSWTTVASTNSNLLFVASLIEIKYFALL